jgi:hypothetical protein
MDHHSIIRHQNVATNISTKSQTAYIDFVVLSIILISLGSSRHMEYIQYVLSFPTIRDQSLRLLAHILHTTPADAVGID